MFAPAIAGAVTIIETLNLVNTVINLLVPIIISIALVVFFWGLVQLLMNIGEDRKKAINLMIWGVVAIFVMVSIWGIIRLLQNTFKVNNQDPILPNAIQLGRTY